MKVFAIKMKKKILFHSRQLQTDLILQSIATITVKHLEWFSIFQTYEKKIVETFSFVSLLLFCDQNFFRVNFIFISYLFEITKFVKRMKKKLSKPLVFYPCYFSVIKIS